MRSLAPTPIDPGLTAGERSELFSNQHASVQLIPSEFGEFTVVAGPGGRRREGGAVVVFDGRGILMVHQRRYAIGQQTWEIPRGSSDDDEPGGLAAARELAEETGLRIDGHYLPLGLVYPDTGALDARAEILFVRATSVTQDADRDSEVSDISWLPAQTVIDACLNGAIADSYSVIGILRAHGRGLI